MSVIIGCFADTLVAVMIISLNHTIEFFVVYGIDDAIFILAGTSCACDIACRRGYGRVWPLPSMYQR